MATVVVPVQAATPGAAGNASAGTVTTIVGSIPGIDTVNNANVFANGADAESVDDARARFRLWISSLSKATLAAVQYAIASVQHGVSYSIVENQNYAGATQYGYFYAVVDDGSGSPSSTFLSSVYSAIDAVRGLTISFNVFGPVVVSAHVSMTITTAPGATHSDIVAIVHNAISSYLATLTLGQSLPISKLSSLAYDASSYVTNVTNIQINSSTADLTATAKQVIRGGTITIS